MSDLAAVEVSGLEVHFPTSKKDRPVRAVDGVDLSVSAGSFHAIVGESGCGKTTLARTIVGLQKATSGGIKINGRSIADWMSQDRLKFAKEMQFVFQNPLGSLSRRQSIGQSLEEPLLIHGIKDPMSRRKRVNELLELVSLPGTVLDRLPRSLSGGQRQRVAIAGAMALNPSILICDEPLSALDVSIRAQIVGLFTELQRTLGLTIVIISHDLAIVREMCSSVSVMYLGKVVEVGDTEPIFDSPSHPYTQALLSAVPSPNPTVEKTRERIILRGDPPSPMAPPPGCRFNTRCPIAVQQCEMSEPQLLHVAHDGLAACHFSDPKSKQRA